MNDGLKKIRCDMGHWVWAETHLYMVVRKAVTFLLRKYYLIWSSKGNVI